jgi:hypothetical protein
MSKGSNLSLVHAQDKVHRSFKCHLNHSLAIVGALNDSFDFVSDGLK